MTEIITEESGGVLDSAEMLDLNFDFGFDESSLVPILPGLTEEEIHPASIQVKAEQPTQLHLTASVTETPTRKLTKKRLDMKLEQCQQPPDVQSNTTTDLDNNNNFSQLYEGMLVEVIVPNDDEADSSCSSSWDIAQPKKWFLGRVSRLDYLETFTATVSLLLLGEDDHDGASESIQVSMSEFGYTWRTLEGIYHNHFMFDSQYLYDAQGNTIGDRDSEWKLDEIDVVPQEFVFGHEFAGGPNSSSNRIHPFGVQRGEQEAMPMKVNVNKVGGKKIEGITRYQLGKSGLICDVEDSSGTGYKHECDVCHRRFVFEQQLIVHLENHSSDTMMYPCLRGCGISIYFTSLGDRKGHYMTYHGGSTGNGGASGDDYKCEFCEKTFKTRSALQYHTRVHTGEKPYICNYCGHPFARKTKLTRHMRSHTDERPYACHMCDTRFRRSDHLTTHLKRVHKFFGPSPYKRKPGRKSYERQMYDDSLLAHPNVKQEGVGQGPPPLMPPALVPPGLEDCAVNGAPPLLALSEQNDSGPPPLADCFDTLYPSLE